MKIGEGPLEQWEAELERVSKSGLISLIGDLAFIYVRSSEVMLENVRSAKRRGKYLDRAKRYEKFRADPDKAMEASLRKKLAAVKAANRRKREAKREAKR